MGMRRAEPAAADGGGARQMGWSAPSIEFDPEQAHVDSAQIV